MDFLFAFKHSKYSLMLFLLFLVLGFTVNNSLLIGVSLALLTNVYSRASKVILLQRGINLQSKKGKINACIIEFYMFLVLGTSMGLLMIAYCKITGDVVGATTSVIYMTEVLTAAFLLTNLIRLLREQN